MKIALPASAVAFLISAGLHGARADWQLTGETGALYDSNFSNSDRSSDSKDDTAWLSDVRLGNAFQLSRDLRLSLGADLREEVWARFADFNNIASGGDLGLRYRFGLGRLAPWVRIEDSAAYAFFQKDDRSGRDNKLRVKAGMGLNERLAVEVAYIFDDFSARDDFWNLSGQTGALRLTFDLTSTLQVALAYSYRNGEVISYALPARPDIFSIASQAEPITSFGSPPYTAYRLRASTNSISVSAGYTINRYLLFRASYEFRDTSRGSLEYTNHLVEAALAFVY